MKYLVPLALVLAACVACGAAFTAPATFDPCPPEHELRGDKCVYFGGYVIPGARPDAGK